VIRATTTRLLQVMAVAATFAALSVPLGTASDVDLGQSPTQPAGRLWEDVTAVAIGRTKYWTNKVEIADLDGDGRPDLLFANGGDYSKASAPEPNQVFLNSGSGFRFSDATAQVMGPTPDLARVIKARDLNSDGLADIMVGTTYQTQSRLYLGAGRGRFTEVTRGNLPAIALSVGDLEPGDVDGDGDLDLVAAGKSGLFFVENLTKTGGRLNR
jgi:FG-GAP-like repeat